MDTKNKKNRYPIRYMNNTIELDSKKEKNDDIDDDYTELNNFIIKNYIEIMELCCNYYDDNNEHNDKLDKIIYNFAIDGKLPWYIGYMIPHYCIVIIARHCIKNNNLELFSVLAKHYNEYMDGGNPQCSFIEVLCEHNDQIPFLCILIENNMKIHTTHIAYAIGTNNTKFIDYLGSIGKNIVKGWDMYLLLLTNNSNEISMDLINIPMIKVLMDHKINISLNLEVLIDAAIEKNKLDIIDFLIDSFHEHDINLYLNKCCEEDNDEALIYFLKKGANIHSIDVDMLLPTTIGIIKVLINHNYPVPTESLKYALIYHFIWDSNLNNVNYLLKIGAQMQWIFIREDNSKNRTLPCGVDHKMDIYSILEYIITKGEFNKIKFLAENYLNMLKPEIDRLFILACANGQNNIASYLFDLGAELNDKALIGAIFFGHFETIIMLLKLGINLISNPMEENLFDVINYGCLSRDICASTKIYYKLIDNNSIFRNDVYNYSPEYLYLDIIKLLINCNVQIGNSRISRTHGVLFYDVDVFTYFLQNGMDINQKWDCNTGFLDVAIRNSKLDIIEFLLLNKINTQITSKKTISIINSNEQIKNLLLKYGVNV